MTDEVSVGLVLDKSAKEAGYGSWEDCKKVLSEKGYAKLARSYEQVAELGFVAGQKQKEKEGKKIAKDLRQHISKEEKFWKPHFGGGAFYGVNCFEKRLFGGEKKV